MSFASNLVFPFWRENLNVVEIMKESLTFRKKIMFKQTAEAEI